MIAVVQRVTRGSVRAEGAAVAEIGAGFVVLLGVADGDSEVDAEWLAEKIVSLRVFRDDAGKMNLGLDEVGGELLVVSQFTLLGDCRKGRRPSFVGAAQPERAQQLYERFIQRAREIGARVATGIFQATMEVELVNDGPVTLLLDSRSVRSRETPNS